MPKPSALDASKQQARQRVWDRLAASAGAVDGDPSGRIPAFNGSDQAAELVRTLPEWAAAKVVKAVPDRAQLPVRVQALQEDKLVYMAVPNLAEDQPFYLLDPAALTPPFDQAASGKGAARVAPRVGTESMQPVDLVVCGSVAVNHAGVRLGKGAGYSDIEVALLQEAQLIGPDTVIVTTVHGLQVVDEDLPETDHDFRVDVIVTPDAVIRCGPSKRPVGLVWDDLDPAKIAAIPVLARMARDT